MELKPGYKQIAMQQLPTGDTRLPGFTGEWNPLNMGRQSYLKARIGWQGLTTAEYLESGDYGLVTGTDFREGRIDWDGCHFVEKSRYDQDRFIQLKVGDVLVTKDGTIGKAAYIDHLPFPATLNSGVFVIRPLNDSYVPKYLFYILMSHIFTDFLNKLAAGSTISHLYQKDFVGFEFSAPPTKKEQSAIVEVLSDMDALLKGLDRLIVKKRDLKQATMQQLLTGKTRLPGFSGEWGKKKISDLLTYERPDKYIVQSTESVEHGDVPVLTANKSFILHYTDEEFGVSHNIPVILFDDFTTDCKYVEFPFKVKSSAIKLLHARHDRVSLRYVYERMKLIRFPLADHKRYYISEYQNIEFLVPDYEEQVEIVSVLSDIDAEIATLE